MAEVHPTAILTGDVRLGEGAKVGPWCVLTADNGPIEIGDGCNLLNSVTISGPVRVGAGTMIYPGVCIGFPAQDYKFKIGDPTAGVTIGERCLLREHVTIHAASNNETPTTLGDEVFLMAMSHVAHDCKLGDGVILVNNVAIGGHVQIDSRTNIGGGTVIHQHCRIGRFAMLSGGSSFTSDVPPFAMAAFRNVLLGANRVGLRRAGIPRNEITEITKVYRTVFVGGRRRDEMLNDLDALTESHPMIGEIAAFIRGTTRTIATRRQGGSTTAEESQS